MKLKEIKLENLVFDLKMREKEIEISNKYLNHLDYMKDQLDKLVKDILEKEYEVADFWKYVYREAGGLN